jgi:hypothetical protein
MREKTFVEICFPGILGIEFCRYDGRKIEEWKEILKGLVENELGKLMLMAYYRVKREALQEALEKNLFFLCREGMRLFWEIKRSGWLPK